MSKEHYILLLQLINNNGDINILVNLGYTYSQIANLIVKLEEGGFAANFDGRLRLTDLGSEKLRELNLNLKRANAELWISPLDYYKIEKLKDNEIYLPNKKKLKL